MAIKCKMEWEKDTYKNVIDRPSERALTNFLVLWIIRIFRLSFKMIDHKITVPDISKVDKIVSIPNIIVELVFKCVKMSIQGSFFFISVVLNWDLFLCSTNDRYIFFHSLNPNRVAFKHYLNLNVSLYGQAHIHFTYILLIQRGKRLNISRGILMREKRHPNCSLECIRN